MNNIKLKYQPIVKNDKIVSIEALFDAPCGKSTKDYILSISNSTQFDLNVIKQCLNDVSNLDINVLVSINIHTSSLFCDKFTTLTIEMLKEGNFILELINHDHIDANSTFLSNVKRLQQNGIKMSVEEFGKDSIKTDLALTICADQVKFDRSLTNGIDKNYHKFKILSCSYLKVKALGINDVVFEGIENKRQKELIDIFAESHSLQGYLFYPEMDLNEIETLNNFSISTYENESGSTCIEYNLDRKLYDFILSSSLDTIEHDDVNNFIKENDNDSLIYNNDVRKSLKNLRNIYFSRSSVVSNGVIALLDSTEKIIIIRNNKGVVIYDNKAHRNIVGTSIIGLNPRDIVKENKNYLYCLKKDRELLNDDNSIFHKSIEIFDNMNYDTIREKLTYNDNKFVITSICSSNYGLLDLNKDDLTKFYTRSFLNYHLNSYESRILAFLDLNNFKYINDNFGHLVGDQCLTDFACVLNSWLREKDTIIRYGGDEFIIIFDSSSKENISKKLESINSYVERYFSNKGYSLSFSFGLSVITNHGLDKAITEADQLMYAYKAANRSSR